MTARPTAGPPPTLDPPSASQARTQPQAGGCPWAMAQPPGGVEGQKALCLLTFVPLRAGTAGGRDEGGGVSLPERVAGLGRADPSPARGGTPGGAREQSPGEPQTLERRHGGNRPRGPLLQADQETPRGEFGPQSSVPRATVANSQLSLPWWPADLPGPASCPVPPRALSSPGAPNLSLQWAPTLDPPPTGSRRVRDTEAAV